MADLFNQQISATYSGLLKTSSSGVLSASLSQISDGRGNTSPLYLSTGSIQFYGAYAFPNSDGSANQVLKTDGAGVLTWENDSLSNTLDFSGGTGTGSVTLDTQVLAFTGTANEIVTSASSQAITLSFPTAGVTLPNGSVATTQTASNNSTKVATTAYVDNQVSTAGTVTSVALSVPTGLTVTGSPITTSGTITIGGTLGVANGGTGATTLTGILLGNGTSAISSVTDGTVGQVLSTNGSGTYSFADVAGGDVSISGTPVANQVAIWTDASTIEGDAALTYISSILQAPQLRADSTNGTVTINATDETGGTAWLYFQNGGVLKAEIAYFIQDDFLSIRAYQKDIVFERAVNTPTLTIDGTTGDATFASNVGIGISPSRKLDVQIGSGSSNGVGFINGGGKGLEIYTDSNGSNADVYINQTSSDLASLFYQLNGSTKLAILSTGAATFTQSVGSVVLDSNGQIESIQDLDYITAGGRFTGKSSRGNLGEVRIGQTATGADGGYIAFRTSPSGSTSPTEKMRISSGGVATFKGRIYVDDTDGLRVGATASAGTGTFVNYVYDGVYCTGTTLQLRANGANAISMRTNGDERLNISSGGNVGINQTPLGNAKLYIRGADSSTSLAFTTDNTNGLGTFSVRNDGVIASGSAPNAPYSWAITSTRDLLVSSNGNFGTAASIREAKINIENESNVNWLYDLNPVKFNYRKRDEKRNYLDKAEEEQRHGLIAEEVEEVNTDFCWYNVNEEGDKTLAGVDYKMLITPMLKAIQEQQTIIEDLKARIETLEG